MATGQPVGIGDAITGQLLAQVLGFPDVEHQARRILHQVNAGPLRQLPEEIRTQPLNERTGIWKQHGLDCRHASI